jgi:hypothetical protein
MASLSAAMEVAMTTLTILTAARELIEPPGSWCQGCCARAADGDRAFGLANAAQRCGLGAIWTIQNDNTEGVIKCEVILAEVAKGRGFDNFPKFNDDPATTHAMILAAFDRAIEKAKSI